MSLARRVAISFFSLLLIAGGLSAQDRDPISPGVATAVLLATHSIQVDRDTTINSGDLVVNNAASGAIFGELDLSVDRGVTTPTGSRLIASRIDIDRDARVGSVYYNQLVNEGTITGTQNTPLALPVFSVLPALLDRSTGGANVDVPNGATQHIAEGGDYAALTVGVGSTAIFDGGGYAFTSITVSRNAVLRFSAPTTIVVSGRVLVDREVTLAPTIGSGLSASAMQIHVRGANGGNGSLNATPRSVDIGRNCTISANIYAPNGSLVFDRELIGTGSFIARDIFVARNSILTLASASNAPPAADAQRVSTNGSAPVTIALTGSDPDGQSLAFSIVTNPTHGTLSAITPTSPTSANVTYTPAGSGNVADSFTFRVTDPVGATGSAVVSINPPRGDTPPPPATTVIATDATYDVVRETATLLGLTATAPAGVTVTFSIVPSSGPFHGSLGSIIPGTPTTITYAPDNGYVGDDSFQFQACGVVSSVNVCDNGTITIHVLDRRTEDSALASDVEVSTPADTPILISLGSASPEASLFRVQPLAAFLRLADVAGNVADANNDTVGDNHNALPGSVPVFMSAGVGQSGGPGSNGTVRMQIEFDISSLGTSIDSLRTATVQLPTHRGTVDSLDTKWYVLDGDNDGLLTDSDFAASGELAAIMPVPPLSVQPIGASATFTFDVLGELKNAMLAGRSFLSVQGRVDETLAGPARGLEVNTTASGNSSVPELHITTPGVLAPRIFSVLTLPPNGTIFDGNNVQITSVPYTLPDARVTYVPNSGFVGTDSFDFRVTLGLAFEDATVRAHVLFGCEKNALGCNNGR